MVSRDGGLCRVKLPGGRLTAAQAVVIADTSEALAAGVIELTNRANLQLRGVKPGAEPRVSESLIAAGLGPHVSAFGNERQLARQTAVADDVRNLMLSAAAGLDVDALCDTTPLAAQILARLENEPRFAALSPKFSILLDGGESLAALDHPHDLWLSPMPAATNVEPMFVFGFAGQPTTTPGGALAAVRSSDVPAVVQALLHTFIDLAAADHRRMRDLLQVQSADDIADRAAATAGVTLQRNAAVRAWQRAAATPLRRFGAWPQRGTGDAGMWYVGAQAPLGRIDAPTLRAIAQLSLSYAGGSFRLTPWQGVLIPDVHERNVPHVERELDRLGMIRDAQAPLGRLIACTGSTGCAKGAADTKGDARELAARLHTGLEVHLSGCLRSCAAAHRAPWTLLAVGPARYDLYRRTPGRAGLGHRPDDATRFGKRLATQMTIEDIALRLNQQDRNTLP
ncbi:precorrin-3B synthase [Pandoraea sp. NPDC087047]|uniref:precorrin-3B synthase n=1 Tax=Pandoraea sp. NPDC087047 TaxID=3364390 RepID=UPI0037F42BB5